ncbi:MAG: 5'-nucleotidase C-terminal domain-containing protein [Deltaproteobacteria bacterium]
MNGTSLVRSTVTTRLFVAGLMCVCVLLVYSGHADASLKLTILYMNDPHAHYAPHREPGGTALIGGFARAAALIKEITERNRAQGRTTLILMGGDLLTGTPFSTIWKGELGVSLMNRMQFTAMAVGNHEFDEGSEHLIRKLRPAMNFRLLSANIVNNAGQCVFERSMVKKVPSSPTKIFIFGLTTEETPTSTHPENVKGLRFLNAIASARELLAGSSDDDLVIALAHLGVDGDKELARSCPKIDLIVGGHSHTALFQPLQVNRTLIVQAGAYAEYLGRLDLEVVDGRIAAYQGALIHLGEDVQKDREISAIINRYEAGMDSRLSEVIGRTDVFLDGRLSTVRSGKESNLGRLIAFLMAQRLGTQVALLNGGAIRASLNTGDITRGEIYTVLPFPDHPVRLNLTGKNLQAVLQRSADLRPGSGGKLQTFGVTYHTNNGNVVIDRVGNAAFNPEEIYSVAINDFLLAGGDGYTLFKEKGRDAYQSPDLTSDLLIRFAIKGKVITSDTLVHDK